MPALNSTPDIDSLAEAIWRRVIGYGIQEAHMGCLNNDPDDCGLYREIWDELTMRATAQTKEG